ncbi:DUF4350 domain-containing protein [Halopiger djelfimassiliensis]|uniref:DUF4350 domain-containing protein n=1 Tax=Halopiger djelfimassiliensis TaxID=1293047 RepID=UPI000A61E510|nr:DUF4350 domain-containing protein [Halopiger djelfimassiliensis]
MNGDEIRSRVMVFVAVILVTVAATAAAGVITNQGTTARPTVDQDHFQPGAVETPTLERGGEITIDDGTGSKTVAIDVAHGNDVSTADLQPVVSALTAAGHSVTYHETEDRMTTEPNQRATDLADTLQDADALIVVEPRMRYTAAEAEVVDEFASAGGRVLFAAGPDTGGMSVPAMGPFGAAAPSEMNDGEFASVTSPLGIAYDTGYLYNMAEYEHNFRTIPATPATGDSITDGVDRAVFEAPTPVATAGSTLLTTSATTEHSENREAGEYGVVARHGNAVAVGDTGFMTTENHNVADNDVLIGNLLEFLVTGNKSPNAPSAPGADDGGSETGSATMPVQPPEQPDDTNASEDAEGADDAEESDDADE